MTEFVGKVLLEGQLLAMSGLHIGGSTAAYQIGGVVNPVVKDGEGRPYIPGSSLKGKFRSLHERLDGRAPNSSIGSYVRIHVCKDEAEYKGCDVCQLFGVPAQGFNRQARLTVHDAPLDLESITDMQSQLELLYTEVKSENAIDRLTSAANPRQMERVPAGARFAVSFVLTLLEREDARFLPRFLDLLRLLEDDALGGGVSRGSGRVAFEGLTLRLRPASYYRGEEEAERVLAEGKPLSELLRNPPDLLPLIGEA